ncbi:Unknown protein sequence [Pseudomonas syringae pv. maculicola]|nr:Unknown protein sequence [Pseudomonas syringae pv. maculicola]
MDRLRIIGPATTDFVDVHAEGKVGDRNFFQHAQLPMCVGTVGNEQERHVGDRLLTDTRAARGLLIDMISPH